LFFPGSGHTQLLQEKRIYKKTDSISLHLYFYIPAEIPNESLMPAVIFFFGGGWVNGTMNQFKPHCLFLADHGVIGITAEYRIKNKHGTTPLAAIADAKSAMRWLKTHGKELGIDPERIVASGGSAGGHLAAATATIDRFNDPEDEISIDPTPCALILFNPVLDTEPLARRFESDSVSINASPINFVDKDVPPTLIFHGTDDNLIPFTSMLEFQNKMQASDNYCEVILFGGFGHGFFNKGRNDNRPFERTLALMAQFIDEFVF
jgi:acetyl esterase/lipase